MSIAVATTTITVLAVDEPEPGEGRTETTIAAGVRAAIGSPSGVETVRPGGGQTVTTARLSCDPVNMPHTAIVVDESTGERWEVTWALSRTGMPGLEHVEAQITRTQGLAA